jgi:sigma-B regulation protein RsbU (phosphoserine phosphatase)
METLAVEEQRRILIVDDERLNIKVLADLLKPNYKIMAAISGEQALKAVRSENPPDLILLDVMMPEMDGYEVCRKLKADENTREIPVIFVTAMGQESDETRGLELGAADYITKPISPAIVEARVRTQMERKHHLDQLQEAYRIINAQKDRMQEELNVGRDIQLSMLPHTFPPFPKHDEFQLHATMQAAREVGGDFYDFFFIDEDHLCVCVGDVSGKGVPAALFMAITKVLIKSRAADDFSTASILTHVNDEICENNESSMFVTIFLGILDIQNGDFVFTNAGHNPSYIKRADSTLERLEKLHGPVVGAMEGLAYGEMQMSLVKGDMLLAYTDGVTEAMDIDERLFSEERLVQHLLSQDFDTPESLTDATIERVEGFAGEAEQADDITLLALSYQKEVQDVEVVTFKISIPNRLSQIDTVNDQMGAFCEDHGVGHDVVMKLSLVFDELLNNVISYGFQDEDEHGIDVGVELLGNRLMVTISDDGVPFNPFLREEPDISLSIEEREIGGLGIHLVRKVMDEYSYKRRVNQNVVTLIKYLN